MNEALALAISLKELRALARAGGSLAEQFRMHKDRSSVPNLQLSLITVPEDVMPSSRLLRHLYIQHAHLKMRYFKKILNKK